MAVLKVEDMACNMCVQKINQALESAGIGHEVSLENKTVTIDGDASVVKKAIEELDEIGFDAVES